jgi:hypothetical protein
VVEHAVPGHLHVVEEQHRVVFVEMRRQRVVEGADRVLLVAFAGQHLQALGVHRQAAGEGEVFLAGL